MSQAHPDDEALSALLDGVGPVAAGAHVEACDPCRQRLAELGAVARAVSEQITPDPPEVVDAAIRAAIDASRSVGYLDGPDASSSSPPRGAGDGARQAREFTPRPARARARVLAVAAAVIVAGATVGVVLSRWSAPAGRSTAASSPVPSPATGAGPSSTLAQGAERPATAAAPSAAIGTPGGSATSGGAVGGEEPDLGEQSDPTTLARLLSAAATGQGSPTSPGASAAGAGPAADAGGPALSPATSAVVGRGGAICAAQAVAYARLGGVQAELRYAATLRYRSQDAVALVYSRVGGRTAVVLRRRDCAGLLLLPSL
jgi:hypothetical protein